MRFIFTNLIYKFAYPAWKCNVTFLRLLHEFEENNLHICGYMRFIARVPKPWIMALQKCMLHFLPPGGGKTVVIAETCCTFWFCKEREPVGCMSAVVSVESVESSCSLSVVLLAVLVTMVFSTFLTCMTLLTNWGPLNMMLIAVSCGAVVVVRCV